MGAALPRAPVGTGGHPESKIPSKVWSRALVFLVNCYLEIQFNKKKIRVTPPLIMEIIKIVQLNNINTFILHLSTDSYHMNGSIRFVDV